jgi:adenylosuccinate lyase
LNLLSPLDGRYRPPRRCGLLSPNLLSADRVRVELNFLLALSKTGLVRPLTSPEFARIESILLNFSIADAESILEYERITRHDVKAIEYFIQSKLQNTSLEDLIPWIHFGLTSEDTNSIGQAIALNESRTEVILPAFDKLFLLYAILRLITAPCR